MTPHAVIGHSSGEVAAAFCAGILSKSEALKLAFFQGVAVAATSYTMTHSGAMLALHLSPEECETMLSRICHSQKPELPSLSIACYNSPQNSTLSGEKSEIDRIEPLLEAEGIMVKRLNVGVAYHNAQYMQMAASLYQRLIRDPVSTNGDENI